MNERDLELALKKERLLTRSEALRRRLADQIAAGSPLLAGAARLRDAFAWLRAHPLLPIAAAVAFLVARPSRALRWGRRALIAWRLLKRVLAWTSAAAANKRNAGRAGA